MYAKRCYYRTNDKHGKQHADNTGLGTTDTEAPPAQRSPSTQIQRTWKI